jgi:hypothetical protein
MADVFGSKQVVDVPGHDRKWEYTAPDGKVMSDDNTSYASVLLFD